MKVEVYGRPNDQACQDAVSLFKSAKIKVEFYNTDKNEIREDLVKKTQELQKLANYSFGTVEGENLPIVISPSTGEVLVGYSPNKANLYDNIFKKASDKRMDDFIEKYPEWQRK